MLISLVVLGLAQNVTGEMGVTAPLRDLDKSGQMSQSSLSFSGSTSARGQGLKLWEMAQDTLRISVLTHGPLTFWEGVYIYAERRGLNAYKEAHRHRFSEEDMRIAF